MGASVQPVQVPSEGDRISRNIAAMRAQGATDDDVEAYLTQHEGLQPQAGASGTWGNEPQPPSTGAHLLNMFSSIPGVQRLEALSAQGASHLAPGMFGGQPISYEQSLNALHGVTGEIDPKTAALERFLGTLALAPVLPKNPMKAGALLGGADQLLSADPESAGERAAGTVGGTLVGGALGKATDMAMLAGRSLLGSVTGKIPTAAALLLQKQADRAASAKTLYGAALAEGQGKTGTQAIQSFLAEPDIAEIVSELKSTRPFAQTPKDSPEMLDAVYKTLSDRAGQIKKGLEAVSPTRPNIGRFRGQDIAAAQQSALTAVDPVMPSYRKAVNDFSARSKEMDAIKQGYTALIKKAGNRAPSANQLTKISPEAFADWAAKSGSNVDAAQQGLLGGVRQELGGGVRRGYRALSVAPSLLRLTQPDALPVATGALTGAFGATSPDVRKAMSLLSLLGVADAASKVGGLLSSGHSSP